MHYSNKKFLVQVERAETDGYLDFGETVQPYFKGNLIATDEYGNQSVLTESYFYENFIGVRKLRKTKTPRKSPFEAAYAQQLVEFGSLPNQEEDQDYIKGTQALVNNKAF
jgi:hypothetical protein